MPVAQCQRRRLSLCVGHEFSEQFGSQHDVFGMAVSLALALRERRRCEQAKYVSSIEIPRIKNACKLYCAFGSQRMWFDPRHGQPDGVMVNTNDRSKHPKNGHHVGLTMHRPFQHGCDGETSRKGVDFCTKRKGSPRHFFLDSCVPLPPSQSRSECITRIGPMIL